MSWMTFWSPNISTTLYNCSYRSIKLETMKKISACLVFYIVHQQCCCTCQMVHSKQRSIQAKKEIKSFTFQNLTLPHLLVCTTPVVCSVQLQPPVSVLYFKDIFDLQTICRTLEHCSAWKLLNRGHHHRCKWSTSNDQTSSYVACVRTTWHHIREPNGVGPEEQNMAQQSAGDGPEHHGGSKYWWWTRTSWFINRLVLDLMVGPGSKCCGTRRASW